MLEKPLVSVITAAYNSERYIVQTIKSILNQTYTNLELLITDDCSNDNTYEIVKEFANKDSRIKYSKLDENSGPGVARNNSIKNANGRFIAFCDSDDQWKPEKLEKQISFMINNHIDFSFSSYEMIDENNNAKGIVYSMPKVDYKRMLRNNYIGCLTAVYDTKRLGKNYMPHIRSRQDWALWLKLLKKTNFAYSLNEPLSIYRIRNSSVSSNKLKMVKYNWLIYNRIENYGIIKSIYLLIRFLYYYLIK